MTIPTTVSVAPDDEYPADGHTMTDKLTATLDKAGVRAISTDLWGIFFEDISYSGDGGLNADLVQNGAFEYNRADSIDWSNYSFWRKIVPEGSFAAFCIHDNDPVATENPHYATVEVEHAPAALDNTGWDGMVFRAGETYDFTAWMRVRSESAMPVTVSLRGDDGSIIAENTITVSASAWTTYQASLTVPEHGDAGSSVATQGTLRLAFAGEGVIDLDFVTLEPRTTYHGLKHFRPDAVGARRPQTTIHAIPRRLHHPRPRHGQHVPLGPHHRTGRAPSAQLQPLGLPPVIPHRLLRIPVPVRNNRRCRCRCCPPA